MTNNNSIGALYTLINENNEPDVSGGYVLFGSYPTGLIKDESLISTLNGIAGKLPSNGDNGAWTSYKYYIFDENDVDFMWYVDVKHQNEKYRGVYFTQYRPDDTMNFSEENCQEKNGYLSNTVYWFKYEAIKWKILDKRDGKAWVITDNCIDSQAYRNIVWENSYVKSSIRKWLNNDFINIAFNENESTAISPEIVVNEMEDVDVMDGNKPGKDTLDRVHLLSIDDAVDMIPNGQRKGIATDYAKCQGIHVTPSNSKSVWWLRTPYYTVESWAQVVGTHDACDFGTCEIGNTDIGIRPALWLKL